MNYEEAMNFIQNTNKFGSVLGLDNIKELLERLGNPQDLQRKWISCGEVCLPGIFLLRREISHQ